MQLFVWIQLTKLISNVLIPQLIELNLESFKLVREKEANPESQKFKIDLK